MEAIPPSKITLSVNGLSTPIRRQGLAERIFFLMIHYMPSATDAL